MKVTFAAFIKWKQKVFSNLYPGGIVFLLLVLLLLAVDTLAQTTLTGKVTDGQGNALPGANVFLLNTLDGTSTDASGRFSLKTEEKGNQVLVVSNLGYEMLHIPIDLENKEQYAEYKLKEKVSNLNVVVVTAGTFEASNDREVAILRPLDIATTAGAGADIVGAIQTLPGTQRVGEQTGLFVRGGDASESLTIIDGMVVQNAFSSSVPGVAQRSRFSPFQFKGIAFSSGGYSARYGQALSSVLELHTLDMPEKSTLNAGLNMAGVSVSASKLWANTALALSATYNNVSPFYKLAHTNFDFYQAPEGGGLSGRWLMKNKDKGLFKILFNHSFYGSGTQIPSPETAGEQIRFGLNNENSYFNSSYRHSFNNKLYSFTALSFSYNTDHIKWGTIPSSSEDWRGQIRAELGYDLSEEFHMLAGAEIQWLGYRQQFDTLNTSFNDSQLAVYAEATWRPARWIAIKPGIRAEHSEWINSQNLGPRISLAIKTGQYSQVATAGGLFFQNPNQKYLLAGHRPDFQKAIHYIANYQWLKNDRSFRIEAYYKTYDQLIKETGVAYNPNPYRFVFGAVDNAGHGYAKGLDVFWRDKALIKNLDYWLSYSLIDTKRFYENFPTKATPSFISNHNLNVIVKYFIESLQINVGASYNYASGRPYYNPDSRAFLGNKTPAYQNLSLNASYLSPIGKFFTVFYLTFDNVTNRKNIYGYRYSVDGQQRFAIEPPLYRSVFAGIVISLSTFNKDEL